MLAELFLRLSLINHNLQYSLSKLSTGLRHHNNESRNSPSIGSPLCSSKCYWAVLALDGVSLNLLSFKGFALFAASFGVLVIFWLLQRRAKRLEAMPS
ncbi:hypothetical protein Sbal_4261 [Shewanella baltica OS155]|jgi:hypothetical protein|uniref:Uncharacterized protein n=1 Tax=Shewanella baltica (strain OS155 / ATCC BAA-1091) TaxID=325240 RepID=A3DAG3_SHEB5|nr:hypothetical protein [Shewanella baltica]ABN63726.1 hypothetical protein Sbal_4261 [Shewanella baltica OS155]